jgi:ABC-type Fe3+-hydroxamate transport system substrate-binding protein
MKFRLIHCVLLSLMVTLAACGGAAVQQPAQAPVPTAAAPAPAVAATTAPVESTVVPTTAGFPVTIENCGRTLTFTRPPERAVVTYEAMAELLVALGLGDRIVGVQYGRAQEPLPEQAEVMNALPYLAEPGQGSASKETLINTSPDLVLVTYFAYDLDPSTGAASEAGRFGNVA